MAHRKWKEAKQLSGTAGPGNMLDCFFPFTVGHPPHPPCTHLAVLFAVPEVSDDGRVHAQVFHDDGLLEAIV